MVWSLLHIMLAIHCAEWENILIGDRSAREEARNLDLDSLALECEYRFQKAHDQIIVDIPRCDAVKEDQNAMCKILHAWTLLNRGVGYYQGLNLLASALYKKFKLTSSLPMHDTLAALGTISRVHTSLVPMHSEDNAPIHNAAELTRSILREVGSANASLTPFVGETFDYLQIFVIRVLPVCFASLFDSSATLYVFWGYMFRQNNNETQSDSVPTIAARRSKHLISALMLNQVRLWKLNKDQRQNFKIFEAVTGLLHERDAKDIVRSASHLETLERLGGHAM